MFLIRHAAWVTPLNFLIVRLESHALLYYDPAAMLERISSPIGVEAPEVVEMCGDPLPVRFAWLVSPNDSVIADTDPRLAKLDIFFLTVVAAPLGCSFPTTTWSGIWLHRKFQIAIHILGHKICVVMWIWAPWILQTTRDMLFRYYFIYLFATVKNRKDLFATLKHKRQCYHYLRVCRVVAGHLIYAEKGINWLSICL